MCKSNPTKGIKKLREGPSRVRYLIGDEWTRLEKAVNEGPWWLYPACILARDAGLRKGEILRLTWSDIDMGNALMRVKNTKAGRSEVIPLNSSVIEILWHLPRDAEYLIHTKNKTPVGARNLSRAWEDAVEKAEISDLRFHDLRHDFASRLVMAGSGIEAAKVLLRHSDLRMAARYAHLSPGYLREAVEAIKGAM